jgi:hypothetical protein
LLHDAISTSEHTASNGRTRGRKERKQVFQGHKNGKNLCEERWLPLETVSLLFIYGGVEHETNGAASTQKNVPHHEPHMK